MDLTAIILFLAGAALLIWPHAISRPVLRKRAERLEQLRNGAEEEHLDERRELEAYGWVGGTVMWRVIGIIFILKAALDLLPPYVPLQGP